MKNKRNEKLAKDNKNIPTAEIKQDILDIQNEIITMKREISGLKARIKVKKSGIKSRKEFIEDLEGILKVRKKGE